MTIHKKFTRSQPSRWKASCVSVVIETRPPATYAKSLAQSVCKHSQKRKLLLTRFRLHPSKLKSHVAATLWRAQLRAMTSRQTRSRSVLLVHARNTITSVVFSKTRTSTFTRTIRIRRVSVAHSITAVAAVYQETRFKSCSVLPVLPPTISSVSERIVAQSSLQRSSFSVASTWTFSRICKERETDSQRRRLSPAIAYNRRLSNTRDTTCSRCRFVSIQSLRQPR